MKVWKTSSLPDNVLQLPRQRGVSADRPPGAKPSDIRSDTGVHFFHGDHDDWNVDGDDDVDDETDDDHYCNDDDESDDDRVVTLHLWSDDPHISPRDASVAREEPSRKRHALREGSERDTTTLLYNDDDLLRRRDE